jgi:SAM-dependent methyltransferase
MFAKLRFRSAASVSTQPKSNLIKPNQSPKLQHQAITFSMLQPQFSPAADRNKQSILDLLCALLPAQGHALEIASGTGQHVAWFAAGLPQWNWQPSDAQPHGLPSIEAHVAKQNLHNVRAPALLDVMAAHWLPDDARFDLIYCANMLHISPWATCAALMRGSARHLAPGGMLITYGPYLEDGVATSAGNLAFDDSLRAQNPTWGIRRREAVELEAAGVGLHLSARHAMPANNLLLVWKRTAAAS